MRVNIITNLPHEILRRQELSSSAFSWIYSSEPVDADLHVVYGIVSQLSFPSISTPRLFVAVEPPEIFKYDLSVLATYDYVLTPNFDYVRSLENVIATTGLLNWSLFLSRNCLASTDITQKRVVPSTTKQSTESISTVVSLKRLTSLQERRLEFTCFLKTKIPTLSVYGRGFRPIEDKLTSFAGFDFHLAIENSIHPGYWTEKLADSLLCGTKTFYIGDPNVVAEFQCHGIIPVKIDDFEEAASFIKTVIAQGVSEQDLASIQTARKYILEKANLFSRIVEVCEYMRLGWTLKRSHIVPRHRFPARIKFDFLFSEVTAPLVAAKYRKRLL